MSMSAGLTSVRCKALCPSQQILDTTIRTVDLLSWSPWPASPLTISAIMHILAYCSCCLCHIGLEANSKAVENILLLVPYSNDYEGRKEVDILRLMLSCGTRLILEPSLNLQIRARFPSRTCQVFSKCKQTKHLAQLAPASAVCKLQILRLPSHSSFSSSALFVSLKPTPNIHDTC